MHSWVNLPEQVKQHIEPWRQTLKTLEEEYGEEAPAEGEEEGTYAFVRQVLWLVPLAEAMQQSSELRSLYPLIHHAVIELKPQPFSVPQEESLRLIADAEGQFRLFHITSPNSATTLGVGNVEMIVSLAVDFVKKHWQS